MWLIGAISIENMKNVKLKAQLIIFIKKKKEKKIAQIKTDG